MVNILTQVAVTLVAWLILAFVSTNLTGLLVGGFLKNPEIDTMTAEGLDFIAQEHQNAQRGAKLFALGLIFVFLVVLYYFWNIGLVIAALMLIAARIPDQIWEINHGRKLEKPGDTPAPYQLLSVIHFVSLPVIWYALYRM